MTEYRQHPLSAAFPGMTADEFGELRADIAANGLHHPITLYEELVLDGWHRHCACGETGTEARYTTFEGDWRQAIAFVKSANVARRHLSTGEKADIAAAIATLKPGRPENSPPEDGKSLSLQEAADLFGVGRNIVADAKVVAESEDEALKADVKAGKVSRKAAAKKVRAGKKKVVQPRSTPPAPKPHVTGGNVTFLANSSTLLTVEHWQRASAEQRHALLSYRNPKAALNEQKRGEDTNLIDWARWSWNPIVGCLHDCPSGRGL